MKYLAVKNFEHFQHYKDRRPPWIKLYQEVLEDYDFTRLQDASRSHLLAIWLLASRYENRVPYDAEWIGRAILASSPVDLDVLISAGFLTVCGDGSAMLAKREQDAKPEVETERETETEKTSGERSFETAWEIYPPRNGTNSRRDAQQSWNARIREKQAVEDMVAGARRYRAWCDATGKTGTEKVMQGKRFFGPSKHYLEPYDLPEIPLDAAAAAAVAFRDKGYEDEKWLEEQMAKR